MGISKTEHFSKKQNVVAEIAKAFGHPARVAIIEYLAKKQSCICAEIVDELPLAQATVSQHLKELKQADVIKGSIEGNAICYCLNQQTIAKMIDFLKAIDTKISNNNCC